MPLVTDSDSNGFERPDLGPWILVFDLDGTLIDSSQDLCSSVNAALVEVGLQPISQSEVSSFIGDGAASLVRRALLHRLASENQADLQGLFERSFTRFLDHYHSHKLDTTRPYPGVMESLRTIHSHKPDLLMAVLTNKPVRPSREICDALGLSAFLFVNYGGDSFQTKKPATEGLLTILAEARTKLATTVADSTGLLPERAYMIGDSPVDIQVGRACGLRTIGCRYGLAPEALAAADPDLTIDTPGELPAALGLHL